MHLFRSALCAIAVIAAPTLSQCSTLTVSGTLNPGETITISVTGATPDSATLLVAGHAGSTTIQLPGDDLLLGVDVPFVVVPLGMTDASGDVTFMASVPADFPAAWIPNDTFTLQAVTIGFSSSSPPFAFCVSNTATLVSGTG
jgi:hypothetical protein